MTCHLQLPYTFLNDFLSQKYFAIEKWANFPGKKKFKFTFYNTCILRMIIMIEIVP